MFSHRRRSHLIHLALIGALLCTLGAGLFVEPASAQVGPITVSLRPPTTGPVNVGDLFSLDLFISASAQPVDGIGAVIQFPTQYFAVVDASGNPVTQITPDTTTFETVIGNQVNNTTGQINYDAGKLQGDPPTGEFRVASIRFRVNAAVPAAGVSITLNGTTASLAGNELPTQLQPAAITGPAIVQSVVANFSGTPLSGIGPFNVQFTDTSVPTNCSISSWAWDFGDGSTSTQQNPSHTYAAVTVTTSYTVSLTVGCGESSDTETKTQYITVNPPLPVTVTANFSADRTSGRGPLTVQFTDGSTSQNCTISGWRWTFGDGATSSARNPSHTYAAVTSTQRYDVSLTVTCGEISDTEVKDEYIRVDPQGTTPTPTEIPEPSTILLLLSGVAGLAGYARYRSRVK